METTPEIAQRIDDAMELQAQGDLEGAAAAFLEIAKLAPDDWRLVEEAGNLYCYHLGRPADAIPCFRRAVEISPEPGAVHHKLGFAYAAVGDDAAALAQYELSLAKTPGDVPTRVEVAKLRMRQKKFDDALAVLEEALVDCTTQRVFGAGVHPQAYALALMNKARVCLVHKEDAVDRGMNAVGLLLEHLGDTQRCTTLANELRAVGREALAAKVEAARDAHASTRG